MREIRFRGKPLHKTGSVFDADWFVGYLQSWNTRLGRFAICSACISTWPEFTTYEIDPNTIGQFTGLKDSKGVDMYEGDIIYLNTPNNKHIIEWNDCALRARQIGATNYIGLTYWNCNIVVIGNIHDNPDLIKI